MSLTSMTHYMTHILTNTSSLQIDLNQICKLRNQVANQVAKTKWQTLSGETRASHMAIT